jgi:hypothetical protein
MLIFERVVYLLCGGTSALCAYLLALAYFRQRTRLLLWSAVCFVFLAGSNLLVFVDIVLLPQIDLFVVRTALSLVAVGALIYAFVWELD